MIDDTKTKKIEEKEESKDSSQEKENKSLIGLKQKNEELENKYKRALADYQNLEKRVVEEKREWAQIANRDLLLKILPVLDTLILAKKHSKDQAVAISSSQFIDVFKQQGVKKIETVGKKFDPILMEAVEVKTGAEGIVLEELRGGYTLYDKVLRVAEVIVGKGDVD